MEIFNTVHSKFNTALPQKIPFILYKNLPKVNSLIHIKENLIMMGKFGDFNPLLPSAANMRRCAKFFILI